MKITFFLPTLVGGGAERVLINLANAMYHSGHSVDFIVGNKGGILTDQLDSGINLYNIDKSKTLFCFFGLVRYLKKNKTSCLITGLDHVNIVAIWAKIFSATKTPLLITLHNTISSKIKDSSWFSWQRIFPFLIDKFYNFSDLIVAVSCGVARDYGELFSIDKNKIRVIPNPVITDKLIQKAKQPIDHEWFNSKEHKVIISSGRLVKQKRFEDLLAAFVLLKSKITNAKLVILGEGELRSDLEFYIQKKGLQGDVWLPGFVDNPYKYIVNSEVFVLSSGWEGLPTVLIEAGALGVPIVSTDCHSGPAEILKNGKIGKLVPVGDTHALAMGIEEVIRHPPVEHRKDFLETYDAFNVANSYLELISSIGKNQHYGIYP